MLHALWRVLFALGQVEVVQVVKQWRYKEQVVVVKVKVEVEVVVVVVEWPVKLWVVVPGVQALLSSCQLTGNAMVVVEVERVVVEQEWVEVKVEQVEVEVEWECKQWWAGRMVMIAVVQTEASGETVTLLQAPLLAQTDGFLQIAAHESLSALGLKDAVASRDLAAIRQWYAGQDAEMFNEKMMRLARLRYIVTSHDPFESDQLQHCLTPPSCPPRYRSAVALDKLLEADWPAVCRTLKESARPMTLRAAAELARECVRAIQPVFVTAATPDGFVYHRSVSNMSSGAIDADLSSGVSTPSPQQVLDLVLLPLCREFGVALSLRMGTRRAVSPSLGLAGDGVGAAELRSLGHLCEANPDVKFLFTVLSRTDQHEAAVLATKFRNLHLWGCWWYCNYPSVVSEATSLRLEMLGTKFTFQAPEAQKIHRIRAFGVRFASCRE
ncbi:hypothetical protein AK812_SmicGene25541 [Symbiodinium microadriaticum]|uniref:Uncharacterized protein n=1 Tax=Symbiodinium microadriaticum TaxID=2951 RepID=A0A1Q9DC29_SYMMI|nr:hypothetical protein AK812_SmicGene25541 [Symbiodinium microadriaticum]